MKKPETPESSESKPEKHLFQILNKINSIVRIAEVFDLGAFLEVAHEKMHQILSEAEKYEILNKEVKRVESLDVIKVVIDGNPNVGKTKMLKGFTNDHFDAQTKTTVGVDFFEKEYDIYGRKIRIIFWDVGGKERFDYLRPFCYKGANCLIIVIDLTASDFLERLNYFLDLSKEAKIKPNQIILVGSKKDLVEDLKVDSNQLNDIIKKQGLVELIETTINVKSNFEFLFKIAVLVALYSRGLFNSNDMKKRFLEIEQLIQQKNFSVAIEELQFLDILSKTYNLEEFIERINEDLNSCKHVFLDPIVKKEIQELGQQYARLHLIEIAEKIGLKDEKLIVPIIQEMIKNKEIFADYFMSTKSVTFDISANKEKLKRSKK